MEKAKNVKVTKESPTGLNQEFNDSSKRGTMTRGEFVREIKKGNYQGYHVRKINHKEVPCSNPDGSEKNNSG